MSATLFAPRFRPAPEVMAELRTRIDRIERTGAIDRRAVDAVSVGAPEIDAALPWGGLPHAGLHEVFGDAPALGFAAGLLARLGALRPDAPILWCQQGRELYGQGLADFGLDPERVILVHGRTETDILWAMEEGLATQGLAAVVGVLHKLPPVAGRRLQLAAEEHGSFGLLLRPLDAYADARAAAQLAATSMALTRWRVASARSEIACIAGRKVGLGPMRWRLELQRCRLSGGSADAKNPHGRAAGAPIGAPRTWQVEWHDETGDLSVVAALRDGSAEPVERVRAAS